MLLRLFGYLLLCTTAFAQAVRSTPSAGKSASPASPTHQNSTVKKPLATNPSAPPVITIQGLCNERKAEKTPSTQPQQGCKTTISRAEFERAVDAIQPDMPAASRKRFADGYAMGLVMAHAAHEKGLDRGASFEEMMRLMRIQVMAQEFSRNLRKEASQVSDKQLLAYYNQHPENYQEADLERIYIPKTKQVAPGENQTADEAKKEREESESSMKKEAEDLHARALKGEDFAKLQMEAFASAGIKVESPTTKLSKVRAASYPVEQRVIFSLKPGSVSDLITSTGGYFIYKLDSKSTVPLAAVKDDIHNVLQEQNYREALQVIQHSVQVSFDENYFKSEPQPAQNALRAPGQPAVQAQ